MEDLPQLENETGSCQQQQQQDHDENDDDHQPPSYVITGVVAHGRLQPLLPSTWIDVTKSTTTKNNHHHQVSNRSSSNNSSSNKNDKVNNNNDNDDDKEQSPSPTPAKTTTPKTPPVDFLWENTPRQQTKDVRDHVHVYSHLPNGQTILDSKWVLGRLFPHHNNHDSNHAEANPLLATCETYCFYGIDGYEAFARRMKLITDDDEDGEGESHNDNANTNNNKYTFPDILQRDKKIPCALLPPPKQLPNLWVVKDAAANGAGGIWVVGPQNAKLFLSNRGNSTSSSSPLYPQHKYVAQRYVWPPILYDSKKFHIRVYVMLTYDGCAYIHRRAFLHVANEPFTTNTSNDNNNNNANETTTTTTDQNATHYDDTIHITNCCANSHDDDKFVGEILADFEMTEFQTVPTKTSTNNIPATLTREEESNNQQRPQQQPQEDSGMVVVPLGDFFPSVQATVSEVAKRTFPFMDGGHKNNGFEYCGMDFILSYKENHNGDDDNDNNENSRSSSRRIPVAYLLEINAPPSQDTATGLPHAEQLHNEVLQDWMNYWVIPRVTAGRRQRRGGSIKTTTAAAASSPCLGGWRCVYDPRPSSGVTTTAANEIVTTTDEADSSNVDTDPILPSKAAILNKIRWTLFERKISREEEKATVEKENQQQRLQQQDVSSSDPAAGSALVTQLATSDGENGTTTDTTTIDHPVQQDDNGTRQYHTGLSYSNLCATANRVSNFVRTQFPFFHSSPNDHQLQESQTRNSQQYHPYDNLPTPSDTTKTTTATPSSTTTIFFESAGGAQVPQSVIDSMTSSLVYRHRSVVGNISKQSARRTSKILFGASQSAVVLGPNASSLFSTLAQTYLRYNLLTSADEIVVSTENHKANFDPWIDVATRVGATIKLWTPNAARTNPTNICDHDYQNSCHVTSSRNLADLITPRTRIVTFPHVSNILGYVNPISEWAQTIKSNSHGRAHIVVDGVAAVPHVFAALDEIGDDIDWYVVSMHKLFGPHLGILLAKKGRAMDQIVNASGGTCCGDDDTCLSSLLETGTVNLEGCAGVTGLLSYMKKLANQEQRLFDHDTKSSTLRSSSPPFEDNLGGAAKCVTSAGDTNCSDIESPEALKTVTVDTIKAAYRMIAKAEAPLVDALLKGLTRSSKDVQVLAASDNLDAAAEATDCSTVEHDPSYSYYDYKLAMTKRRRKRVPTVSFYHRRISSKEIVAHCERNGILCRCGCFLCTENLLQELNLVPSSFSLSSSSSSKEHNDTNDNDGSDDGNGSIVHNTNHSNNVDGFVRFSLTHYNTVSEIQRVLYVLKMIPGW